jgi:cyclopropane-fatty-acyl-phospholipid synthase
MTRDQKLLASARALVAELGRHLDIPASVELWDGNRLPLGSKGNGELAIVIDDPGVIASLVRWPTLDRLIRHYAAGHIDLAGGSLIDLGHLVGDRDVRRRLKSMSRMKVARHLLPFLGASGKAPPAARGAAGNVSGEARSQARSQDFIQFHYDVGNDFYRLFLDAEMIYTCAYFTDPANTLDRAQQDKLDMICRKLRLRPGERFLDIGCGWGGLVCHAAHHFGVVAHGVTLSPAQLEVAEARIAAQGLEGKVTVELKDFNNLEGSFDKIASIGMYEAIGVANLPGYFAKMRSLLAEGGLFLNHGITRRAKRRRRRFEDRAEQRALQKYIFPGGELDDIGNTVAAMERAGFEIHDVEAWRWHYARTTRLWCERLTARRAEAEALVGAPTVRIWLAYLAGCSLAFERGSARIFQTLASKSARGQPPLPPTRADLYR